MAKLKKILANLLSVLLERLSGKIAAEDNLSNALKMGKEDILHSISVVLSANGLFLADLLASASIKAAQEGDRADALAEEAKEITFAAEEEYKRVLQEAGDKRAMELGRGSKFFKEVQSIRRRNASLTSAVSQLEI